MTAAIVIDTWKLPIFKKNLDADGYDYTEHASPELGMITLKVETDNLSSLGLLVKKMQVEASLSKMN